MEVSTFDKHRKCYDRFQSLLALGRDTGFYDQLRDEFDKYSLWADSVGAIHPPRSSRSLDHRLRYASPYKQETLRVLTILADHLSDEERWLCPAVTPPAIIESDQASITSSSDSDSPWEVSSDSEPDLSDDIPRVMTAAPPSEDLLEATKFAIKCLYSLPLRRPAPIDRLRDKFPESREPSPFAEYDLRYIRDKFPLLDPSVQDRLGNMVTRRRDLLAYRQLHGEKLDKRPDVRKQRKADDSGDQKEDTRDVRSNMDSAGDRKTATDYTKATTTIHVDAHPPAEIGVATTLAQRHLHAATRVEDDTRTSPADSVATRELQITVPPRPTKDGTPVVFFKCKYCCIPISIETDRAWRDHILGDLQPFVCTYPNCHLDRYTFENADSWFNHETQFHRVEHHCGTLGHQRYANLVSFRKHLTEGHNMNIDVSSDEIRVFHRPARSAQTTCNLCLAKTSNSKRHVSRHLRQIALFSLPRADYCTGEDEGSESAQAMRLNESDGLANSSSSGRSSQVPQDIVANALEEEILAEQEEVPVTAPSFWDEVSTYGVISAREGHSDPPPMAEQPKSLDKQLEGGAVNREPTDNRGSSFFPLALTISRPEPLHKQLEAGAVHYELASDWPFSFLPESLIRDTVTKDNILANLSWSSWLSTRFSPSGSLADRIYGQAKKIFAILTLIGQEHTISDLIYRDNITDKDLPLKRSNRDELVLIPRESREGETAKEFRSFTSWDGRRVRDFLEKQWLVLAPVLDVAGKDLNLDSSCPLPFEEIELKVKGNGVFVHKASLHPAHQLWSDHLTKSGSPVAIKQIHHESVFDREKENLEQIRNLDHAHLIKLLASCKKGSFYCFIFPWAEGGTLWDFWVREDESPRTSGFVLWMLDQVAGIIDAIRALHEKNIRHGDVKPQNILHFTDSGGGRGILVLADFGSSRVHKNETLRRNAATTTLQVTILYEAPEAEYDRAHGQPRSRRYDMWSIGCTLLEFVVWLLYGFGAVTTFRSRRTSSREEDLEYAPGNFFRQKKGKVKIHTTVEKAMELIQADPRCKEGTALGELLDMIEKRLLRIEPTDRAKASELCTRMKELIGKSREDPSFLWKGSEAPFETPRFFKKNGVKKDRQGSGSSVSSFGSSGSAASWKLSGWMERTGESLDGIDGPASG